MLLYKMDLIKEWKKAGFTSPNVNYAFEPRSGETFLVVEDDSTIYRLVNSTGTVYVIAAFRCSLDSSPEFLEGTQYYVIDDPILHVVLCGTVDSERDRLAIDMAKRYLE